MCVVVKLHSERTRKVNDDERERTRRARRTEKPRREKRGMKRAWYEGRRGGVEKGMRLFLRLSETSLFT